MKYIRYIITGILILLSVNIYSQFLSTVGGGAGGGTTASPLLDSLFAYYPLDETSGQPLDVHGSRDLTKNGTVTQNVSGKVGTAYTFVTDGYLTEASTDFEFTGSFSISLWFKTGYVGGAYQYFTSTFAEWGYGYGIGITPYDLMADMNHTSGNSYVYSATTLNDDNWYHVVLTYSTVDDSLKMYLNSSMLDGKVVTYTPVEYTGACNFTIGCRGNLANFVDGELDEVGYWRGIEFRQGQIDSLYNSGNGLAYPLDY